MSEQSAHIADGSAAVAGEYAAALLDLAQERSCVEQVAGELSALLELLGGVDKFREFLATPTVPAERKIEVLSRTLQAFSPLTRDFLGVLVRNGRGGLLAEVARQFRGLRKRRSGRLDVAVTSAVDLEAEPKKQLVELLREMLRSDVDVEWRVDRSVVGGFLVQAGDRVIDATVANRLERMRKRLTEGRRRSDASQETTGKVQPKP